MPKIPTYTANENLDTDRRGMPRVTVDTSAQEIAARTGRMISGIGDQIGSIAVDFAAQQKAREDGIQKLNTRVQEDNFLTQWQLKEQELQKNMREDGFGYAESLTQEFDKEGPKFLEGIQDPQLKAQYAARIQGHRNAIILRGAETEAKVTTAYAGKFLTDWAEGTRSRIAQDPNALEAARAEARDRVSIAMIPERLKADVIKKIETDFETIAATKMQGSAEDVEKLLGVKMDFATLAGTKAARTVVAGGVEGGIPPSGVSGDPQLIAKAVTGKIVQVESGGRDNARNPNSTATGAGQFINSTWLRMIRQHKPEYGNLSNGEVLALRTNGALSREMTTKYAEENANSLKAAGLPVTPGAVYLAHFLGPAGARAVLSAEPGAPVAQAVGGPAVRANRSILEGKTAAQVIAWADRKMGGATPAGDGTNGRTGTGRFEVTGEADPRFRNLSLEQRQEIVKSRWIEQDKQVRMEAQKVQFEADQREVQRATLASTLLADIDSGALTRAAVEDYRQKGIFDDKEYKDANKRLEAYEGRDAGYRDYLAAVEDKDYVFSSSDKKSVDAYYEKRQINDGLMRRDAAATDSAIRSFARTSMLPDDTRDMLGKMIMGNATPEQFQHSLATLDRMQKANPAAFENVATTAQKNVLARWQEDLRKDPKTFRDEIRALDTPQGKKIMEDREKAARDTLKEVDPAKVVAAIGGKDAAGGFIGQGVNRIQVTGRELLMEDYRKAYLHHYRLSGDDDLADRLATKDIQKDWAVSAASGGRLAKFAPETLIGRGLMPQGADGDAWMARQVKEAITAQLPVVKDPITGGVVQSQREPRFWLFADERTEREIAAMQNGQALPGGVDEPRKSPVYQLVYQDDAGLLVTRPFVFDVARVERENSAELVRRVEDEGAASAWNAVARDTRNQSSAFERDSIANPQPIAGQPADPMSRFQAPKPGEVQPVAPDTPLDKGKAKVSNIRDMFRARGTLLGNN